MGVAVIGVLGATGRIGRRLVDRLTQVGVPVVAISRRPPAVTAVVWRTADLASPRSLDAAFEGVSTLFLLSKEEPGQVELQGNAIGAAKRAGVARVTKVSAFGSALDAALRECRWHAQTERELEASGLAYTYLRPNYFMQNLALHLGNGQLRAPMGNGRISMVDCRDVADVAAVVLCEPGHEGKVYELTGAESLSFADAAARLGVAYVDVAEPVARAEWLARGLPGWRVESFLEIYRQYRDGFGAVVTTDVATVTGTPPRLLDVAQWATGC
jgi:uncharacterized protein YbjT (DUF2867 family)